MTIPVTVTVGDSVFRQINSLDFTKTLNSTSNPLPQVFTVASTGDNFNFYTTVVNGTGGNWLTTCASTYQSASTPNAITTVTAAPAAGLGAGTYTAEIILNSTDGTQAQVIPVTLTVSGSTATYFDELPGAFTFSAVASSAAILSQPLTIRNAGAGTLDWVASTNTADGGSWLSFSSTSGVSPSNVTVSINRAKLPNQGQVAGTFTGQVLLQSIGGIATIPVTVSIGASVFEPEAPLNSTKNYQGANPSTQSVTVASTGSNFNFYTTVINGTGGSWLTTSASTY